MSSLERQKGINDVWRSSIENHKGAIAVQNLWQYCPTLRKRKQLLKISRNWAKCVCHVHGHQYHDVLTWIWMSVSAQNSGLEVEHAKSNLKTSHSQIWVISHLPPFVRVGQNSTVVSHPVPSWLGTFKFSLFCLYSREQFFSSKLT